MEGHTMVGDAYDDRADNLEAAVAKLIEHFHGFVPQGYLRGKTEFRDALVLLLQLSLEQAETMVEELEARGFIRYRGAPAKIEATEHNWSIARNPASVSS